MNHLDIPTLAEDFDTLVLDIHGVVFNAPLQRFLFDIGERTREGGSALRFRWKHELRLPFWEGRIDEAVLWRSIAPGMDAAELRRRTGVALHRRAAVLGRHGLPRQRVAALQPPLAVARRPALPIRDHRSVRAGPRVGCARCCQARSPSVPAGGRHLTPAQSPLPRRPDPEHRSRPITRIVCPPRRSERRRRDPLRRSGPPPTN